MRFLKSRHSYKRENFFHRVLADKETILHVEKRCKCEVPRMMLFICFFDE
ncbi:hypothetical protein SELSPUOL_00260 [Selenomonas sputigena ATCC 35185]|uniref:Uncharacterized protein n=1 Tax=Selenomonas sputigena (strain ATCC 35185 / DSM 20758 / CCUG 44933 / VPI D19B-28) TaxID=546271 RepID=C9LS39_SELS3|nr:hypothetical protein SELSPUOL_00260 [Selenomonas sputigena ATCC 35185]